MLGVSRGSLRRGLLVAASSLAVSLTTQPASAQTSTRQQVTLEAQPLAQALNALGVRYDVTIFAADDITRGKVAKEVTGNLTLEEALVRLLAGTGLSAQRTAGGAYVVVREGGTANEPAEIVVSGQNVRRTLQETSDSVAVLTGDVIDQSYITNLREVLQRTPNVFADPNGSGFSIRGIPERGVGSGTGDTAQTVAVYIDGAVQAQAGADNGILGTWDIAQVEVYRGPQTTNQGRAGLAGAVIVRTADPTFDWSGRARVSYGEFDTYQLAGALGGPIIPDLLAFRVAAETNRTDGYTRFESGETVIDDIGRNNRDLVRGKLLFTPASNVEVLASFTHSDAERGTAQVDVPDTFERVTARAVNITNTEVNSGSLEVRIGLSDTLDLTATSAFSDLDGQTDPIAETLGLGERSFAQFRDNAFTQEVQLNFDNGGNARGVFGVYYADIEEFSERDVIAAIPNLTTVTLNDGFTNQFENYAVFGEFELDLGERWTLVAGGRYDTEDSSRAEFQVISSDPPVPFIPTGSTNFSGDASFSAFLPKAGVTYNFSPDASLGFVAQRAYRPGGADINPATNSAVEFDPEFLWNYELVLRIASPDNKVTFNANLFYSDYTDMQIRFSPDPAVPVVRFIDNVGQAELYGLEIESSFRPTKDLTLYASAGFIESEFEEFAFQGQDFSGNEFPQQPPINLAFGGTYEDDNGISGTVDFNYSDDFFSNVQNGLETKVEQRLLVNARVGYKGKNFGVYAFAQNLLDEDYQFSVFRDPNPDATNAGLGQPQTFGVILETQF
ncbi:MAG: TonB-dependent receptor [Pseudomonadota bacterium]